MSRISYEEFIGFRDVILDESFVEYLGYVDNAITIRVCIAMTTDQLQSRAVNQEDMYYYVTAEITFLNVFDMKCIELRISPGIDADRKMDIGSLENMYLENDRYHVIASDFTLSFCSDPPVFKMLHYG